MENNGYVKWSAFRWIVGGICTAFVIISSYVIANDGKRECDKDRILTKLDTIQSGVSDIKVNVADYGRQIVVNTHRLDILESKAR
jgi:hypothetical protein